MPLSQPYFLNGASLSDSTSIYANSAMTVYATDGWYSDGIVTRRQISGVLQPAQPCASCDVSCGGNVNASGTKGVFKINIDTGDYAGDVGAIIIRFSPDNVPDGIKVVFDGVTYNELSGENVGWLGGVPTGLPIFVGDTSAQSSCPSNTIIGSHSLTEYVWDGVSFVVTGTTLSVVVLPSQDKTTSPFPPGMCTMVIPKPSPTPSIVEVTCIGVCTNTEFDVLVECPAPLKKFKASTGINGDPSGVCDLPLNQSYYVASVNGVYPYIDLYDWVFLDPYGITKLPDGYYKTNNVLSPQDTIKVVNGVIEQVINACP